MKTSFPIDESLHIDLRGQAGCEIVGRPGSGKSWLATCILLMAMALGAFPVICDTKRSDFYKLGQMFDSILGKGHVSCVAATPPQVAKELRLLNKLMNDRYEHNNGWGKDWVDFNLRPIVLIFDEFSATMAEADKDTAKEISDYMKQLVFKSRQMGGIYTVLCSQRLNSNVLDVNVSAEFGTRVAMQQLDKISLRLIFPQCDLDAIPFVDNLPGHGLVYSDYFKNPLPQPFVAPDLTRVDVPQVALKLFKSNEINSFKKENYWPF